MKYKLPFVPFERLLKDSLRFGFSPALPENCQHSDARLLKLNAVQPFLLDLNQYKPIAKEFEERSRRHQVQRGTFLINRAGKRDDVGRAVLVRECCANYRYPDLMISFTVREDLILPDFLELYLQSECVRSYFANNAVGSNVSMVKINRRILLQLPVLLPPLAFQKHFLPLIVKLNSLYRGYRLLNEKKRFFLNDLKSLFLSQHLTFQSSSFKKWEEKKISEIFKQRNEHRKDCCAASLVVSKHRGIYPSDRPYKNTRNKKFVRPGDFVLSLRAAEGGIEFSLYLGFVSPSYTILRQTLPIVPFFYAYLFKSKNFITNVLKTALSGTRGDGCIDWKILAKQKICFPSIAEQTQIAGLLTLYEKKCLLETQLEQNVLKMLFSLSNSMQDEYLLNRYAVQTVSCYF